MNQNNRQKTAEQNLTPALLCSAYSQGYFPMPDENTGEILWYRPDPRAVLPLDSFHVSRSLQSVIKRGFFTVTYNEAFADVIKACSNRETTWITEEFIRSYTELHRLGSAQSVEVWYQGELCGGCYGVNFGGAFFAESMFHTVSNSSKVALFYLVRRLKEKNFVLLECQFLTPHLKSLGAVEISDLSYIQELRRALQVVRTF